MAAPRWMWPSLVALTVVGLAEWFAFTRSKETRTIVLRLHMLLIFQILMGIGDRYILNTVNKLNAKTSSLIERAIIKVILFIVMLGSHLSFPLGMYLTNTEPELVSYIAYLLLGTYLQIVFCLFLLNIPNTVRYISSVYRKITNFGIKSSDILQTKPNSKNILFTPRTKVLITVFYAILISVYGAYHAMQDPITKHVTVPLSKLKQSLDGLKIVQISDVHLGPTIGRSRFQNIVSKVNQLKPDLVVITGDLLDGKVSALRGALEPAHHIQAPYGKYFVTGNHEYYSGDIDRWFTELENLGVHVLHNSNVKIQHKDDASHSICLAGTDDIVANVMQYGDHIYDLPKAVGSCDHNEPIILLAHQPTAAKWALDSEYPIDLVLSGHTHGGQMFPLSIVVYLANPFFKGLYKYGDTSYVYVSTGSAFWGIPMRIGASMEITEITLKMSE